MPVTRIHCSQCGTEFVDARSEVRAGDEAICPHCGARHVFKSGVPADEAASPPTGSRESVHDDGS